MSCWYFRAGTFEQDPQAPKPKTIGYTWRVQFTLQGLNQQFGPDTKQNGKLVALRSTVSPTCKAKVSEDSEEEVELSMRGQAL